MLARDLFKSQRWCAIRDGDESDSNFLQLLTLHGEDDPRVCEWMMKWTNRYNSHEVQNDMLKVMALKVLRKIATKLQDSSFSPSWLTKQLMYLTANR